MDSNSNCTFYRLKFQEKVKYRKLNSTSTVASVIIIARTLFKIPEDVALSLQANGTTYVEETLIQDLNPHDGILEVVQSVAEGPEMSINVCIYGQPYSQINVYLSNKIKEVKALFCKDRSLNSDLYASIFDDEDIDEDLKLEQIPDIEESLLIFKLKDEKINLQSRQSQEQEQVHVPQTPNPEEGKDSDRGTPVAAENIRNFIVKFNDLEEVFHFDSESSATIIKSIISHRFSLQRHTTELFDNGKALNDQELEQYIKHKQKNNLICKKIKKIVIYSQEQYNFSCAFQVLSTLTVGELRVQVASGLNVPEEYCILKLGGGIQSQDDKTMDEIDANSPTLNFSASILREFRISHYGEPYLIEYTPADTLQVIEKRLMSAGMKNVKKYSLKLNNETLENDKPLHTYNLTYGVHEIILVKKEIIMVSFQDEEKEYVCEEKMKTVLDLKMKLEEDTSISPAKQFLVLLKDDEFDQKLSDSQILEDLFGPDQATLTVLLKKVKKCLLIYNSEERIAGFEGLHGSKIRQQKKIFELYSKLPAANQIWTIQYQGKLKILEDNESFEALEIDPSSDPIKIFRKIHLTVCLGETTVPIHDVPTYETVLDQKKKLYKELNVSADEQQWYYDNKDLPDEKKIEDCLLINKQASPEGWNKYAVDMTVQNDLEYFGFTEKSEIDKQIFKDFYIESDDNLNNIIEQMSIGKEKSSIQFRNKILGILFSTLKKHSLWDDLIQDIKKCAFEARGINLWKNKDRSRANQHKFNTQFLLYYFLNSASPELNVEIIKLIKMHFPVPLAINTWTNRFSEEGYKVLNELYWVFTKSFVITSFGFGDAHEKVCGKTEFNNKIFFTNFVEDPQRNKICKGCPEILFDIYTNDKYLINLIDIPSGTDNAIKEDIINNSNMLIVHSLTSIEATLSYLKSLPEKVPVILLCRDIDNAFASVSSFKSNLAKALQHADSSKIFIIEVDDLSQEERTNELSLIGSKIHEYINKCFKKAIDADFWKFFKFFNIYNQQINNTLAKIEQKGAQLTQAIALFEEIKTREGKSLPLEDEMKSKLEALRLAPELEEFMQLLNEVSLAPSKHYTESSKLYLEKVQIYLRILKSQQTKDYYRLYNFKSDFGKAKLENEAERTTQFFEYWDMLKTKNTEYQTLTLEKDATKDQIYDFIGKCVDIFEKKIVPSIFSIELFWRELVYFTNLNEDYKIKSKLAIANQHSFGREQSFRLIDTLVELRKDNILDGMPFEIIDGDLLYMPRDFYRNVFKGFKDKVMVISVLGPQSSGKSTLLNFLFGCDFTTSAGRCTKGVYGTYFRVSNFPLCDGILVLDTEGLFGLLNKNEAQNRDKFDRKLVLFCLAMSDFVLINFKGDIDKNLTDVLMVCKDSLTKLQQGNVQVPEMFLILNQNTQTNIESHLQDIDKMSELGFREDNVVVLPLAFETKTKDLKNVSGFSEFITKKTPKKEFSDACRNLLSKIVDKIKLNLDVKKPRELKEVMDRMEYLWELLSSFPNLLRHTTLKDKEAEENIKSWIFDHVDGALKARFDKQITEFKNDKKIRAEFECLLQEQYNIEVQNLQGEFIKEFQDRTSPDLFSEMQNNLIVHLKRVQTELSSEVRSEIHLKKIKLYDIEGEESIRLAIRQVKKKSIIGHEMQEEYFENVWKQLEDRLAQSFDRKKESMELFTIIHENYEVNLTNLTGGLPKTVFPHSTEDSLEQYQNQLKTLLVNDYYNGNTGFDYSKAAPVLVFKGGKSDVHFRYFDLRKYFDFVDIEELIGIPQHKLPELFDTVKLKRDFLEKAEPREYHKIRKIIKNIQEELSDLGIYADYAFLEKLFNYKRQFFLWRIATSNPISSLDSYSHYMDVPQGDYQKKYTYVIPSKIYDTKVRYFTRSVSTTWAFRHIFDKCIQWEEVCETLQEEHYKALEIGEISEKIKVDLKSLNLMAICDDIDPLVQSLCLNPPSAYQNELNLSIVSCSEDPPILTSLDIFKKSFNYINLGFLRKNLSVFSAEAKGSFLVLSKLKIRRPVIKHQFRHLKWLEAYAKDETRKLFQNSLEDKTLLKFVYQEFDFNALLTDIYTSCLKRISAEDNWKSPKLHQSIIWDTQDLIGIANNDLQQVSYQLDYKLVGHIHLSVVCLIWKSYEEKNWIKKAEPLVSMQSRKEKEKRYFLTMTSDNQTQINSLEATKAKEKIESYIKNQVRNQKDDIINKSVNTYKNQTSRKQVQLKIDAKYFAIGCDLNDLYRYIDDPYSVVLDVYNNIIEGHKRDMKVENENEKVCLKALLKSLHQRLLVLQKLINQFDEDSCYSYNLFKFIKYDTAKTNDVLFATYDDNLSRAHFKVVLALLRGDDQVFSTQYELDPQTTVILNNAYAFTVNKVTDLNLLAIINNLSVESLRVTNSWLFIKHLTAEIEKLVNVSDKLCELTPGDFKTFVDSCNVFICKHKCPCCDRLCGEDNPIHKSHQVLYGHQMRALGGVMMSNREASVQRCEDIGDMEVFQFNGREMTWLQFKEEMKRREINPWIFNDTMHAQVNNNEKEKFRLAWAVVGQRICSEKYPTLNMKFVEYNQVTVANQKVQKPPAKRFIFMIDSSSSMTGIRWQELQKSLKKALAMVFQLNSDNKVTIINFSNFVMVEYIDEKADRIDTNSLTFTAGGTDFGIAFSKALEIMKNDCSKGASVVLSFMTDGEATYPTREIRAIKDYLDLRKITKREIDFKFSAIGFHTTADIINTLATELGGKTHFAVDSTQLTTAYYEILKKEVI